MKKEADDALVEKMKENGIDVTITTEEGMKDSLHNISEKNISFVWCGEGRNTAALCEKLFPGAMKQCIAQADQICENTFIFRDHWEMEKTPVPFTFEKKIDWQFRPTSDPEWTYAFNRHSFLPALAKAYVFTGDARYAEHYMYLVLDWIQHVPLDTGTRQTAWRPIEAGIRCENWLKSRQLLKDCEALPESLFQKMDESLRVHAEYLISAHTDFQRLSNWGVLQDRGLFLLGIHFQEQSYIDLSLKRLTDNLRLQVLPDGIHWEQSPQYHAEVLQCFLTVIQAAQRCGITLPEGFTKTVHHMTEALARWLKPDRHLVCQSDSDDVDAGDILAKAAILFDDMTFKAQADSEIFEDTLWDLGWEACRKYLAGKTPAYKPHSVAFTDSGNYILQSDTSWLHMHCGPLGSGHGHADLLHIDLFAYGEDILIDSGRYNYQDIPVRRELKSPAGHNTFTVDEKDFTVYNSSWDYASIAQPVKGEYRFTETAGYISGGHLGYQCEGVLVFRKVVYMDPGLYVIFDEIYTKGKHSYTQYFHWNNHGTVTIDKNAADKNSVSYLGKSVQARLVSLTSDLEMNLKDAPLSRVYNELEQGKCLHIGHTAEGFSCLVTVIAAAPAGRPCNMEAGFLPVTLTRTGEILSDSQAQAVRVVWNDSTYTIICLHTEVISEVGLLEAAGCRGYGKILVFTPDLPDGICLAW